MSASVVHFRPVGSGTLPLACAPVPLRYESRYAVLSRFAWRSCLDWSHLRALFGQYNNRGEPQTLYVAAAIREDTLPLVAGWHWRSCEAELADMQEIYSASVWDPDLRFCPICLESGIHYLWFQFDPLKVCPIHGCSLLTHCQSCGTQTARYAFSKCLFAQPYLCHACASPLCGAPFNIDDYRDRGLHAAREIGEFRALHLWALGGQSQFGIFRDFARRQSNNQNIPWCDGRTLLRSAMNRLLPCPDFCSSPPKSGMTALYWSDSPWPGGKTPTGNPKRWALTYLGQARLVYRATLRRLRHAIEGRCGFLEPFGAFDFSRDIGSGRNCYEVAAYFWTRLMFERTRTWRFTWNSQMEPLGEEPLKIGFVGSRMSRRCMRAVVLAVYAAILHIVGRPPNDGYPGKLVSHNVDDLIFLVRREDWDSASGAVIFPAIDWMPSANGPQLWAATP